MKFYRTLTSLFIGVSLLHVAYVPAKAAPKGLMGQVWPDRDADRADWSFEVSGEMEGGGLLPESPKTSSQEMYYFAADQNTTVSFIFNRAYYRAKRSPWVNITSGLSDPYRIMPNMTLSRIQSQQTTASIPPKVTASANVFINASYKPQGNETAAAENLKKELEEQAELARVSKTADVFQFNLEVYEDAYRNQPEAMRRGIAQFRGDLKYQDVSVAPVGRAELYKKMIRRERGEKVDIDAGSLFNMANDDSVSPTIRKQSIRSMSLGTIGTASNDQTLDFLRRNARDPFSKFHVTAMTQLIKIGPQSDKAEILKTLESNDAQVVAPVLTAIEAAKWEAGKDAVIKLSLNQKSDPSIKEFARETASKLDKIITTENSFDPGEWRWNKRFLEFPTRTFSQKMDITKVAKGTEADLKLSPRGAGITGIVVSFRDLQKINGATNYVLWGIDSSQKVVRLGQVSASPNRRGAQIETETSLEKFSLFVTVEKEVTTPQPVGAVVATVKEPGG
jgi:hypothetical protein